MAWNIDNVATHCFYCGKPLDVGGLHAMEAVNFNGKFVCRVFSHSDCYNKAVKENKKKRKFKVYTGGGIWGKIEYLEANLWDKKFFLKEDVEKFFNDEGVKNAED